jgi:uncharacterized membrane protein YdcZ (DUF606 family)
MSHPYSSTLFHVVFSTKKRQPAIVEPAKLWAYIAGVARGQAFVSLSGSPLQRPAR